MIKHRTSLKLLKGKKKQKEKLNIKDKKVDFLTETNLPT